MNLLVLLRPRERERDGKNETEIIYNYYTYSILDTCCSFSGGSGRPWERWRPMRDVSHKK